MKLTSSAFAHGGRIPAKYTADGQNISPELNWQAAPQGTVVFALIMDDPDAPSGTWDHWLIWDIPADATGLAEGSSAQRSRIAPPNMTQGRNSWGNTGYEGPEPPPGKPHRYVFRLYALGRKIDLPAGADKSRLLSAVNSCTLAKAEMIGMYGR